MNYLKSRTFWAVAAAVVFVAAQWFTGEPLEMNAVQPFLDIGFKVLVVLGIIFAPFKKGDK